MAKRNFILLALALGLVAAPAAWGAPVVDLQEWGFNVNGTIYDSLNATNNTVADLPVNFNTSAFNFGTGLGTVTATFNTAGSYGVAAMFDHEMNQTVNGFTDELAQQVGVRAPGQSFQMETPGDVYNFFSAVNATTPLENAVEFGPAQDGSGNPVQDPNDQAMALANLFTVAPGETWVVSFTIGPNAPGSGMYLDQFDQGWAGSGLPLDPNADPGHIYFSSIAELQNPSTAPVPEPATMLLFGTGLIGFASTKGFRLFKGGAS